MKHNNMSLMWIRIGILTLLVSSTAGLPGYAQPAHSQLKVITYNIWNGFNQMSRYDNTDTLRQEKFVQWIQQQKPDVVALQELVRFNTDKLYDLGKRLKLPNTILLKSSGYPVGIASQHPIELIERKIDGMHHGFLHIKVRGIHFFVVHLSPSSYKMRRKEADIIIRKIKKIPSQEEVIILGDFNTVSPHDKHFLDDHPAVKVQYLQGEQSTAPEPGNLAGKQFDFQVMQTFLEAGFKDVVFRRESPVHNKISFPTPALSPGMEWQTRGHRIDYILVTPRLANQCISSEIPHSELTKQISDHFPVVARFKLER